MENSYEITQVAPGVRIYSYKTSRFKTGRISFNIALPLEKDASRNAILPYILNRSCRDYPTYRELNKKLAGLYGATLTPSVSKAGETHVLRLSMTMIDSKFALDDEDIILSCAKLLFDIVFNPNTDKDEFCEAEVVREKQLMLDRLESEKNDKRVYALRRCEQIMCENERFSSNAYGTTDGIAALTPKSIYEAYKNALETGLISVNVVGSANADEIARLLGEYITKAEINRTAHVELHTEIIENADEIKRVEEELPVNQGKLVMGFRAGMTEDTRESEYAVMRVMTDIFGGGTYSRLFMNVREKMSLCYYCSARLLKDKGIIIVQSGIENENAQTAEKEILNQLESLANGNITKEDIKSSTLALREAFTSLNDTPEDIDAWAFIQLTSQVFETPQEVLEKIEKVTEEQVVAAAKRVTLDTVYMLKGTQEGE